MFPNGPFGNMFPYTNFHSMNLDWVIQIAKDFLDQYTHIQQIIEDGETSLQGITASGIEQLQAEKTRLEGLLDAWYTEHSEDIAGQLTQAISDFQTAAAAIGADVIASIPQDYTALSNHVNDINDELTAIADESIKDKILIPYYGGFGSVGYYKTSNGAFLNDESAKSTGLIPIKKGARVTACINCKSNGYAICFLDQSQTVITSISQPGQPTLGWHNYYADCTTDAYNDIAYLHCFSYDDTGYGSSAYVFISYPNNEALTIEGEKDVPFITMEEYKVNNPGGFHVGDWNRFPTDADVYSTPFIPFSNKKVSNIKAKTRINNTYYRIAFFDEYKRLMTNISLVNPDSLVTVTEDIDVTGTDYDDAKYVMATTYENAVGEYLQLYSADYVERIQDTIGISPNTLLNKQTARIFKKVVCVGDSYTAGWHRVAGDSTWSDHPEYAWPHYISDITGNDWLNCGVSGATVLSWMTNANGYQKAQGYGVSQAYVIGLMINDTVSVPLGTSADIGTENPTTYYGGLSKLIRSLASLSPDAHIFVNTCPKTGDTFASFNQAVRDVVSAYASTYKVHLMDLAAHAYMYSEPSFTGDAINGHYTAIGYEQMANIYCYLLSDYINNHISTFQDVYKIPFDPVT